MTIKNIILILFFGMYIVLPEYFAIEFSGNLPLLTASRILLLIAIVYIICNQKGVITYKIRNRKLQRALIIYFVFQLLSIVFGSTSTGTIINGLFKLVFEKIILILVIINLLRNENDIQDAIRYYLCGMAFAIGIGIIQAITGFNIASLLNTVGRTMLDANYERNDIIRATSSFGHPVYFAAACVYCIPFCSYFYNITEKKRYLTLELLAVIGVFASGSRGSILLLIAYFLFKFFKGKKLTIRKSHIFTAVLVFVGLSMVLSVQSIKLYLYSTIQNVTSLFSNVDTESSFQSGRLWQLSAISYILENNPMFGAGIDAVNQGIHYVLRGKSVVLYTMDIGFVGWVVNTGIIGTVGAIYLMYTLLHESFSSMKKSTSTSLIGVFFIFFMLYYLSLLSIVDIERIQWIFIGIYIAFTNFKNLRREDSTNQTESGFNEKKETQAVEI